MGINVVRYKYNSLTSWGMLNDGMISPLADCFGTTGELITYARDVGNQLALTNERIRIDDVAILSPVTRNQQFICQGANYRQHMVESGMNPDAKNYNMMFTKASSCITSATSDLIRPVGVRFLDYEIELGLIVNNVINSPITITEDNLGRYIGGLVIVNDYSARDIQIPEMQFYKGKSFRTFGPVGPYLHLLNPDEIHYIENLCLTLTVNGEVRQSDTTANLVFKPADTLSELSKIQDLAPGDLVATGTPSGCALSIPSPLVQKLVSLLPEAMKWSLFMRIQSGRPYLKDGDIVEAKIHSREGAIDLGLQKNKVIRGEIK